jgi:carboxypeptidase T
MLRFRLESDGWVNGDGFFFDDLKVEVIDTTTSGIGENGALQISAPFPNPADEYVWINTGDRPDGTTLEVMDQFGRVIFTQELAAGNAAIQLNTVTWSSGIYYYRVVSAQGSSVSRKLMKQ